MSLSAIAPTQTFAVQSHAPVAAVNPVEGRETGPDIDADGDEPAARVQAAPSPNTGGKLDITA